MVETMVRHHNIPTKIADCLNNFGFKHKRDTDDFRATFFSKNYILLSLEAKHFTAWLIFLLILGQVTYAYSHLQTSSVS